MLALIRQRLTSNGLTSQVLQSAATAALEVSGPAPDSELPPSLRGKGLVFGKPAPVWPVGRSVARDGRIFIVDDRAIQSLLADGNGQEFVPFTYSHEEDPLHGADNSGYMLHFTADNRFVYADRVVWTADAARKLASGARGPVSPDAYCESLDPVTLEVLTPSSSLYDPGTGSYKTNTFRPMFWRAASLVGVPALRNLPPASLGAESHPIVMPGTAVRKENQMDPKLKKLLGLPEDATDAQVSQALAAAFSRLGLPRESLAASPNFDKVGLLSLIRTSWKIPEVVGDEMLCQMVDKALGNGEEVELPEAESAAPEKKACEPASVMPAPEVMAPVAPAAASADVIKTAADQIRQELSSREKAAAIDAELLAAEKAGKLVAAERDDFRLRLLDDRLAAGARQQLSSRPASVTVPSTEIVGGALDPSISVDRLPVREQSEILSRAAAWSMERGLEFSIALAAVRGGDRGERAYHAQVLAANPDWGKHRSDRSGARGARWPVGMRRGLTSIELDHDLLKHIGKQMSLGAIPQNVVPRSLQEAALQRMKLAGESSSFQPTTKEQVPGFAFGYFEGEYGGSEIAPEVTGGANEEASYPIYGTEKLAVHVNASGVPEPVGRNAQDKERSYWGADWKKVTKWRRRGVRRAGSRPALENKQERARRRGWHPPAGRHAMT